MTLHSDSFNLASNAIHLLQGVALLALGLAEAHPPDNPLHKKLSLAAPLVFVLSAAGAAAAVLYFLGGWSVKSALFALNIKKGFYIFVTFACYYASAGLSRFMYLASDEKSRGWHHVSLAFLTAIAVLYFTMGAKVNEEAAQAVSAAHAAIGATLLAAVLARLLHDFLKRKAFQAAWIAFLLITSFQLLAYREPGSAFEYRLIKIEAGPETKPSPVNPMQLTSQPFGSIPLNISDPRPAPPSPGFNRQAAPKALKKDAKVHNKKRAGN
ncbi:MAG: hypothetical protein HY796_09630 [Elusimicrobia bacterium]|nr:hypothetical protein [Elusimicrobiota bacterium]